MDEPKLEKALPELQKLIARYGAPRSAKELAKDVGELHARGITPLFDFRPCRT